MIIRECLQSDLPYLVKIDHQAYGNYGADKKYFNQKFTSSNGKILVVEQKGIPTGFCVVEFMKANQVPNDFGDLVLIKPILTKWLHIIAFTTATNYADIRSDSMLVKAIEDQAVILNIKSIGVPLSINHPFAGVPHNVFAFWEKNGYKKVGNISWIVSPSEKIPCYFYQKIIVG